MITAVLLSWRRPQNLPMIVKALRRSPYVREILVWNNSETVRLVRLEGQDDPARPTRVIDAHHNFGTLARFAVAQLACYDTMFLQDDDVLVTHEQLAALVREYVGQDRLVGIRGRNLGPTGEYTMDRAWGEVDVVLQAYLASRKAVARVFAHLPSPGRPQAGMTDDAEDDLLINLAQPTRPYAVNVEPVEHLEGYGEPGIARWRRKDHLDRRALAITHMSVRLEGSGDGRRWLPLDAGGQRL